MERCINTLQKMITFGGGGGWGGSMKGKKKWEKTYCTFINLQNDGNIFGVGASFEESS